MNGLGWRVRSTRNEAAQQASTQRRPSHRGFLLSVEEQQLMRKLKKSDHVYSALIAVVITAVAIPFNPGIPWFAWLGAFALLFVSAELFSALMKPKEK